MVPDSFAVNTGPVGKNDPVAGTKGIAVGTVGLTHIGTAKESGVGDKTWGGVVVLEPPAVVQTGILHLLGVGLAAAGQAKHFALLFALGGVADVLRG